MDTSVWHMTTVQAKTMKGSVTDCEEGDEDGPVYQFRRIGSAATCKGVKDEFKVSASTTKIGRQLDEVDFYLNSTVNKRLISRQHAQLERIHDGKQWRFILIDTSLNGTYVNDVKVSGQTELKVGDTVTFGHTNGINVRDGMVAWQPNSEFRFVFECVYSQGRPVKKPASQNSSLSSSEAQPVFHAQGDVTHIIPSAQLPAKSEMLAAQGRLDLNPSLNQSQSLQQPALPARHSAMESIKQAFSEATADGSVPVSGPTMLEDIAKSGSVAATAYWLAEKYPQKHLNTQGGLERGGDQMLGKSHHQQPPSHEDRNEMQHLGATGGGHKSPSRAAAAAHALGTTYGSRSSKTSRGGGAVSDVYDFVETDDQKKDVKVVKKLPFSSSGGGNSFVPMSSVPPQNSSVGDATHTSSQQSMQGSTTMATSNYIPAYVSKPTPPSGPSGANSAHQMAEAATGASSGMMKYPEHHLSSNLGVCLSQKSGGQQLSASQSSQLLQQQHQSSTTSVQSHVDYLPAARQIPSANVSAPNSVASRVSQLSHHVSSGGGGTTVGSGKSAQQNQQNANSNSSNVMQSADVSYIQKPTMPVNLPSSASAAAAASVPFSQTFSPLPASPIPSQHPNNPHAPKVAPPVASVVPQQQHPVNTPSNASSNSTMQSSTSLSNTAKVEPFTKAEQDKRLNKPTQKVSPVSVDKSRARKVEKDRGIIPSWINTSTASSTLGSGRKTLTSLNSDLGYLSRLNVEDESMQHTNTGSDVSPPIAQKTASVSPVKVKSEKITSTTLKHENSFSSTTNKTENTMEEIRALFSSVKRPLALSKDANSPLSSNRDHKLDKKDKIGHKQQSGKVTADSVRSVSDNSDEEGDDSEEDDDEEESSSSDEDESDGGSSSSSSDHTEKTPAPPPPVVIRKPHLTSPNNKDKSAQKKAKNVVAVSPAKSHAQIYKSSAPISPHKQVLTSNNSKQQIISSNVSSSKAVKKKSKVSSSSKRTAKPSKSAPLPKRGKGSVSSKKHNTSPSPAAPVSSSRKRKQSSSSSSSADSDDDNSDSGADDSPAEETDLRKRSAVAAVAMSRKNKTTTKAAVEVTSSNNRNRKKAPHVSFKEKRSQQKRAAAVATSNSSSANSSNKNSKNNSTSGWSSSRAGGGSAGSAASSGTPAAHSSGSSAAAAGGGKKKIMYYQEETCDSPDCLKPSGSTIDWVQCDDCDLWFHTVCVGCNLEVVQKINASFHCGCV